MIRASAPYTSGWGSFVLLKMDHVRLAQGGSLSTLHWIAGCPDGRLPGSGLVLAETSSGRGLMGAHAY